MIISVIIWFSTLVIWSLQMILVGLNWFIPTQFQDSINYFFSYLGYLNGVLDVETILQCISVVMVWMGRWYIFKLAIMVLNLIPGVSINHDSVLESAGSRSSDIRPVHYSRRPSARRLK